MEEKNELNDIILNKGGSNTGSKKLLLAIATLTLVLIIVLVIMNSLKNDEVQKAPQAILPPEPTAPTEIINDPLFEPVEVIQEGAAPAQGKDLDQVAQKIKEESFQNAPAAQPAASVATPPAPASTVATAPSAATVPARPSSVTVNAVTPSAKTTTLTATAPAQKTQPVPEPKKATIVKASKPAVVTTKPTTAQPTAAKKPAPKPEVKADVKPEVKTEAKAPSASSTPAASAPAQGTYYIQVGSFTQEPNKALFDRLNSSGMKYTTQKSGNVTKILVGPFQGEKSVNDAMGTVRQNIEPKAFRIKG